MMEAQLQVMRDQLTAAYQRDMADIDRLMRRTMTDSTSRDIAVADRTKSTAHIERITAIAPGSLRHHIKEAFIKVGADAVLTSPTIYEIAREMGANLNPDRPRGVASLGSVLNRMVEDGLVERVRVGSGRAPSEYRWKEDTPKSERSAEADLSTITL